MKRLASLLYKKGFTLIELLVVISIISLLSSVVLAGLQVAREKAVLARSQSFDAHIYRTHGDRSMGQWTFNDSNNPSADSSGLDRDGVASGASYVATGGFDGQGYYDFDNVSDTVDLQFAGSPTTNELTLSVWVKPSVTSQPSLGVILSNSRDCCGTYDGFHLQYNASGILTARLWDGGTTASMGGAISFPTDKWTHIVLSYNGSEALLFVNGEEIGKDTSASIGDSPMHDLRIGAMEHTNSHSFIGGIDDVRLYEKSLLAQDIKKMYLAGKGIDHYVVR